MIVATCTACGGVNRRHTFTCKYNDGTQQPFGSVPSEVADVLIPTLFDTWAKASTTGQTDAAVEAHAELVRLLRQPALTDDEYRKLVDA